VGVIGRKIYTVSKQSPWNELSAHLSLPTASTVANIHVHVTLAGIDYADSHIHAKLTHIHWGVTKLPRMHCLRDYRDSRYQ